MLSRRILPALAARCTSQSVLLRNASRICINQFAGYGTPARKSEESYDMARLSKVLDEEIKHHEKFVRDEKYSLADVIKSNQRVLSKGWEVIDNPESVNVELVLKEENGDTVTVAFNTQYVSDCLNAAPDAEEEEIDFESEDGEESSVQTNPINIEIKVQRHQIPEKTLIFDVECSLDADNQCDQIYISNLSVESSKTDAPVESYEGPSFESLDESLREKLETYVNRNFNEILPFVAEYSRVKEASMYGQWLKDVKAIATA